MIILPILTTHLYISVLKGWKNVLFELGSENFNLSAYEDSRGLGLGLKKALGQALVWPIQKLRRRFESKSRFDASQRMPALRIGTVIHKTPEQIRLAVQPA